MVEYSSAFKRAVKHSKDARLKERVTKQILKIVDNPEVGKPMRYCRKGTRELRVAPFRIAYLYTGDTVVLLELYHKDEQ